MRTKIEGGLLIAHTPYKVSQDNSVHLHYTAITDASGDIEEFKTRDAATWWLSMDNEIHARRARNIELQD